MYFPQTLRDALGLALQIAGGPTALDTINNRLEDFIADKFQKHMSGNMTLDLPLQELFEDITGRKIK